jgi:hypothetical protein
MDGADLFALMSALGWLVDQPSFAPRADHLFHVIASAILTNRSSNDVQEGNVLNQIADAYFPTRKAPGIRTSRRKADWSRHSNGHYRT